VGIANYNAAGAAGPVEDDIEAAIIQFGGKWGVTLNGAEIRICPLTAPTCTVDNAGAEKELFMVTTSFSPESFLTTIQMDLRGFAVARRP
jgi:hypothetical protein